LGSINFLDVFIIVFLLFFLKEIYTNNSFKNSFLQYLKTKIVPLFFLCLFFIGILFSFIKNCENEYLDSLGIIKSYFLLPILFAIVLNFLIKSNLSKLSICLFSYFAYSGFLGLLGFIYNLFGQLTFDKRLELFFDSPNQLAITLSPGIVIGSYFLVRKKISLSWLIIFLFFIVQVFALWKTASLGAWIGILATIFFIFSGHFDIFNPKNILLSFLIVSLLATFLMINNSLFITRDPFKNINSIDSRLVIYQVSQKIIKENYLFGVGLGNFQSRYLSEQKNFPPFPQWAVPHSHNIFLQIWLETGLISFISFLSLLVYQFFLKKQKKTPILLWAVLIYFLIHGIVDTTIWKNDSALLFWFVLLSI
jgi:O-antigen ligase